MNETPPPLESLPRESYATFNPQPLSATQSVAPITPDNPPYGIAAAVLVWLASVLLIALVPVFPTVLYILYTNGAQGLQQASNYLSTTVIIISVLATLPAHLLTVLLVWAIVTRVGRHPFWQTLGWSWSPNFGVWSCLSLAIALWIGGQLLATLIDGGKTALDDVINSSTVARVSIAFLAVVTAPLVEEMVYRGVLFPALRRALGMLWGIVIVATLFTLVHVAQYYNNLAVIAAVALLSFALTIVRARTGRLLPCFVIHLIFNSITSILILLQPYLPAYLKDDAPQQNEALILIATHVLKLWL